MANVDEPAKLLLPYLQRADELQKHEPLVAYYCRLYAMERGLSIPQTERTKTTNALLVSLMKQLEKDKKSLKLAPDDHLHVEGFALNVLEKADKQDRAGRANLNTAKTFYAASIFFEILNQFGELQPDLEQKQKYAAWKAADIRKAVKEGRKPVPGPPGGDTDLSIPSSTSSVEYDLEPCRGDAAPKFAPEPSPPPQFYDEGNSQHPEDVPPSPSNNSPPSPYPTASYPSHDLHPPANNRSETTSYPQPYHHQPYSQEPQPQFYSQEPQPQFPQNYPSHEVPSYSYPNFQSYPSFAESSLPTAPSHYPSYHQGSDHSYTNSESAQYNLNSRNGTPYSESAPAPTISNHHISAQFNSNVRSRSAYENVPSPVQTYQYDSNYQPPPEKIVEAPTIPNNHMPEQFNSSVRNGNAYENAPPPVQTYQYDSNYQPPSEKIAEAHKAARFAVGALAFDDVSTAVDYLKKSLELLTNPSTGQ